MAAQSKGNAREELLQFLDDLDSLPEPSPGHSKASSQVADGDTSISHSMIADTSITSNNDQDAQSALDFLDEIAQRPTTPLPPAAANVRKSIDRPSSRTSLRSLASAQNNKVASPSVVAAKSQLNEAAHASTPSQSNAGWGGSWSSMWSSATTVIQQARDTLQQPAVEGQSPTFDLSKANESAEHAKKWTENMLGAIAKNVSAGTGLDVGKLRQQGLKAVNDIINAVAPPIAEHEVIEVWLSHDMLGYEGVETLVYKALAKVMEQVKGGELYVNSGTADRPAPNSSDDDANAQVSDDDRNLNTIDGFSEGSKVALARLDDLVAKNFKPNEPTANDAKKNDLPITICPIFMRIQPVTAPLHTDPAAASQLYFILKLRDPTNNLAHETVTQAMPAEWLGIPFEENEWVENEMVDVIRKGVEIVGQEYVRTRQTGRAIAAKEAVEAQMQAQDAQSNSSSSQPSSARPSQEKVRNGG